ncbi:PH domain-containing protein [Knoellia sp. S7-12]|uniref:PH domain-containing protein n=1 Tax=Knoellia sp. S7-12 TaxID=3126698 RepID=UPI0033695D12
MTEPGAASVSSASRASFRSRRGRRMAIVMAVLSVVLFTVLALLVAGPDAGGDWVVADRIMMAVLGLGLGAVLWRWAIIAAVPDESGLSIHNLVGRRHILWDEIADVTFDEGDPWATVHLRDTESVAVMAIQRADGDAARGEAQRLADLVAESRTRP